MGRDSLQPEVAYENVYVLKWSMLAGFLLRITICIVSILSEGECEVTVYVFIGKLKQEGWLSLQVLGS